MTSSDINQRLRHIWHDLWQAFGQPPVPQLDALLTRYTESHRHYHTKAHLLDCLEQHRRFAHSEHAPRNPTIDLALFYHDAIYDPRDHDNESQSATLARADLAGVLPPPILDDVARLITATDHRHPPTREDEQLIVDIDLSILGRPAPEFDRYEEAIRAEYHFVPEEQFRAGRFKIVQNFLSRPSIFHTPYFFNHHESVARSNLARSLDQLQDLSTT